MFLHFRSFNSLNLLPRFSLLWLWMDLFSFSWSWERVADTASLPAPLVWLDHLFGLAGSSFSHFLWSPCTTLRYWLLHASEICSPSRRGRCYNNQDKIISHESKEVQTEEEANRVRWSSEWIFGRRWKDVRYIKKRWPGRCVCVKYKHTKWKAISSKGIWIKLQPNSAWEKEREKKNFMRSTNKSRSVLRKKYTNQGVIFILRMSSFPKWKNERWS